MFLFLLCNALGLGVGTVYNTKTPDLYENNAHHTIGWVVTWIASAQVLMGLGVFHAGRRTGRIATRDEQAAFIPVSAEAMARHHRLNAVSLLQPQVYRYSNDSGQGTERASSSLRNDSLSSEDAREPRFADIGRDLENTEEGETQRDITEKRGFFSNCMSRGTWLHRLSDLLPERLLTLAGLTVNVLNRVILVLGFLAITTGVVTYGGVFVSRFVLLE